MTGQFTIQTWTLIIFFGGISTVFIFLFSSAVCYLFMHFKGTIQYLFMTLAIGLLTIPVALLLIFLLLFYVLWNKLLLPVWRIGRKPTVGHRDADEQNAEVMIHLIHGTFNQDAHWTQSGSVLRKEIEALGLEAGITHFSWDGKNTVASRTRAAIALGDKLAKSPVHHHYLIAHSHGGAIVREMSHLRPDIAHKVQGVCLLSPPFIYRCKIKRTSGAFFNLTDIGGSFAFQLLLALCLIPLGLYDFYAAIILYCLTAFAESILSKRFRNALDGELNNKISQEPVNLRNVQIFQAVGDEADSALRFVSSLHESCFSVLSKLRAAAKPGHCFLMASTVLSYCIYSVLGITLWLWFPHLRDFAATCGVGFISITLLQSWQWFKPSSGIPNILITAAIPVAMFSFWIGVAKALAYGDLRLIFCADVFVASSETPAGDYYVRKFVPKSDGQMMHSTHSHPDAIRDVAAWLSSSEYERKSRQTESATHAIDVESISR